ncbi:hypothetical protein CEUSTIGMA_g611.t1 [Chlamydomonas eustigma]|uniref:histidine kinase n=1 Tax=Chlamydomonas eustigma TaxID=1157962 RepID=A0A250WQQ8_9CHLO|nr:hypothetical protein CEUSTIGMA_g611.t1 [Chlamydomonas eustigma]|eukprot:GAX73158.1 hypothetical protein CEUSTIGMA_g611.t1 [Chlamydomonas eustigma]
MSPLLAEKRNDADASLLSTGVGDQADEIKRLSELVAELNDALKRETRRADLYQQQLEHLLLQQQQQYIQGQDPAVHAEGVETVTITKREYEMLLLRDRAISVLAEGMTIADCSMPDMPLIYANEAFAKITGYSVSETLGKNCRFLQGQGTDASSLSELRQCIKLGRPCVVQILNYKKNGDPFVNYLSVTPIRNSNGMLTHYVGIQSDITELVNHKKAELAAKHAAVQAAAATEAKSQFLARMSHEIRTPLNGMIAVGQLLAETSLSPAQWDLVNTIRCSGETLLTLITDILDFSRIEANKMVLHHTVFKLETVMEAAMEIAGLRASEKRLQVAYYISEGTPRVLHGDAQRLQQIILNVLNNAVKFTERGQILMEVWQEPLMQPLQPPSSTSTANSATLVAESASVPFTIEEGASSEKPVGALDSPRRFQNPALAAQTPPEGPPCNLRFSVRDTGIGISAANVGKLFNSFSQVDPSPTRQYGGSGLGLAISRKLCEAMAGTMWVESQGVGKGSIFSWTVVMRAPSVALKHQRQRRSSRLSSIAQRPQWVRMAEEVGAALQSSSGSSEVLTMLPPVIPRNTVAAGGLSEGLPLDKLSTIMTSSNEDKAVLAGFADLVVGVTPVVDDNISGTSPCDTSGLASYPAPVSSSSSVEVSTSAPLPKGRRSREAELSNGTLLLSSVEVFNPLLKGKKFLLLEPCKMIRQVLQKALKSWGCEVCAVSSEDDAVQELLDAGSLSAESARRRNSEIMDSSDDAVFHKLMAMQHIQRPDAPELAELCLRHTEGDKELKCKGPYDVVIMDMTCNHLLRSVTECNASEAQRIVFMGWPGQSELEAAACSVASSSGRLPTDSCDLMCLDANTGRRESATAEGGRPVKVHADSVIDDQQGGRQLGYVIVTRPVRQGRLMLALEEILAMQLEPSSSMVISSFPQSHTNMDSSQEKEKLHLVSPCTTPKGCHLHAGEATLPLYITLSGSSSKGGLQGSDGSECSERKTGARHVDLAAVNGGAVSLGHSTLRPATVSKSASGSDLSEAGKSPNMRIMLAEDNAINMKVAVGILRRSGHTNVTTVENGQQALDVIAERGGIDAFDLILMDLHMPVMGGMEAVRELGRRYPGRQARVVAVTADAFEGTREDCMTAGFDGWLPKPFRVEDMTRVVAEYAQAVAISKLQRS